MIYDYNYAKTIRGMITALFHYGLRGSGRTTRLLDRLQDGDTVICLQENHARYLRSAAKERGLTISTIVCPVDVCSFWGRRFKGNVYFDHVWLEEFYLDAFKVAGERLEFLHKEVNRHKVVPDVSLPTISIKPCTVCGQPPSKCHGDFNGKH